MELEKTSFMNDPKSQNAKGFQNPPQQKNPKGTPNKEDVILKGYRNLALINLDNESSKEPDGNERLQSSNLNCVVLRNPNITREVIRNENFVVIIPVLIK